MRNFLIILGLLLYSIVLQAQQLNYTINGEIEKSFKRKFLKDLYLLFVEICITIYIFLNTYIYWNIINFTNGLFEN